MLEHLGHTIARDATDLEHGHLTAVAFDVDLVLGKLLLDAIGAGVLAVALGDRDHHLDPGGLDVADRLGGLGHDARRRRRRPG